MITRIDASSKLFIRATIACQQGNLAALKAIFAGAKDGIIDCEMEFNNLLPFSVLQPEIIEYLTDPASKVYLKFNDGTQAVHAAAFAGRTQQVLDILCNDKTQLEVINIRKESLFYYAAAGNQFDLIKQLFSQFTIPNLQDAIEDIISAGNFLAEHLKRLRQYAAAINVYKQLISWTKYYISADKNVEEDDYQEILNRFQNELTALEKLPPSEIKAEKSKSKNLKIQVFNSVEEAARKWGFEAIDVNRNGNCFFEAVHLQILFNQHVFPQRYTPQLLRQLAVLHLRKNIENYKSFFCDTPEAALAKMSMPNEWVDHPTIVALVMELRITLVIISNDEHLPIIIKSADSVATLYIIHEKEKHYQSTLKKDPVLIQKIDEMVAKAEIETLSASSSLVTCLQPQRLQWSPARMLNDGCFVEEKKQDEKIIEDEFTPELHILFNIVSDGASLAEVKAVFDNAKSHIDINVPRMQLKLIYLAAANCQLEVFKYLVEECKAELIEFDDKNLIYSAMNKPEILHYLTDPEKKLYEQFETSATPKITEIEAAVIRGDWLQINALLNKTPNAIFLNIHHALVYWGALVGNFGIVELIFSHDAFTKLASDDEVFFYGEAYRGAKDRAEYLEIQGILDNCAEAREYALDYFDRETNLELEYSGEDGIAENDRDAVEGLRRELYNALDDYLNYLLDEKQLKAAIEVKKKLINCYKSYANPEQKVIDNLQEQLDKLVVEDQIKPLINAVVTQCQTTLFNFTSADRNTEVEIANKRQRIN